MAAVVTALGTATILAAAIAAFLQKDRILENWRAFHSETETAKGELRQPVFISRGEIPISEFLTFLSDYSGLPLLYDSSDERITKGEIVIASDIAKADDQLVKEILLINGIRVFKEKLPGGRTVLKAEPVDPAAPRRN